MAQQSGRAPPPLSAASQSIRSFTRHLLRLANRIKYQTLLVVISILVGFLITELAYRAIEGRPVFALQNYIHLQTDLIATSQLSEYHSVLGWTLRPYVDVRDHYPDFPNSGNYYGFVSTGEFGVRMHGYDTEPVPRHAILAVGDSFTAGSEVANHESWPAYLETISGRPVVNAAAGGWGADQIVLRAEEMIDAIEPSAVIVSFLADDILRNEYRTYGGANKPYFTIESGELVAHNIPVPRYTGSAEEIGVFRSIVGHSFLITELLKSYAPDYWNQEIKRVYNLVDTDIVAVSCKLVERLHARTEALGIPLYFIMQHGMHNIQHSDDEPAFSKEVFLCISEQGIPAIDTWDIYQAIKAEQGLEGITRHAVVQKGSGMLGHGSPEGNRFVARLLADMIAAHGQPRSE